MLIDDVDGGGGFEHFEGFGDVGVFEVFEDG